MISDKKCVIKAKTSGLYYKKYDPIGEVSKDKATRLSLEEADQFVIRSTVANRGKCNVEIEYI